MALYLGREAGNEAGGALRRATLEWDRGELVLEPQRDGHVRLHVTVGSEGEEHRLDLGDGPQTIETESKLIKIEEIGKAGALVAGGASAEAKAARPPASHVNQQSKLIKIEDLGASLPEVTIILPGG